jgi:vitamin B12 transporter
MNKTVTVQTLGSCAALLCAHAYAQTPSDVEVVSVVSSRIGITEQSLASSLTILNEDDIAALGNLSLTDILRQTPSIGVSNAGGIGKQTTLRIRGEEGFRTKLFVDDVEITDPSAPQIAPIFDDLLSRHISRIEILRGVQGLAYGADAGGIVRVYTKQAETGTNASVTAELGSFNTDVLSGNFSFANETSGVALSATSLDSEGFNARTSDVSNDDDGYENISLHVNGWTQLTDTVRLSGTIRQVEGENQFDACFGTNDCMTDTEQRTARLAVDYQHDGQQHQLAIARTRMLRDNFSDGLFGFQFVGTQEQASYLGALSFDNTHVSFGAEYEKEELESTFDQPNSRDQKSVFAQLQHSYASGLSAHAGVRYDDNETFGSFTSYRLGTRYAFADSGLALKANIGTGFRAPSLVEQATNDGPFVGGIGAGLQLNEEQSQGWDLGLEFKNQSGFNAEVVYFNQQIEDEIVFDFIGFGYFQADGKSKSRGVEISAEQSINRQWYIWGNYTYNDTETSTGEQRLRRPEHLANIGVTSSWFDDRLTLTTSARSVRDAVDFGGVALDNYTLLNANLQFQANAHLEVYARIENLTDRDYEEVAGFNTADRSLYVGFTLTY